MKKLHRTFLIILLIDSVVIIANGQKLEGEWKLVQAKQNGKNISLGRNIRTNLIFGEGNRMSGNAGCNHYSTTYTLRSKNEIKFEPIISTRMACLDNNFMKQESTFFGIIEKVGKYQIKGNYLIFFDTSKQNVLRFTRVFKQKLQDKA